MRYTVAMNKHSLVRAALLLCSQLGFAQVPAHADVHLAGIFGDHMVLQRNTHVQLWGSAGAGELIRVRPSWYEKDAAVTAGPDGHFSVQLTTPEASGPHTIRLSGKNELTLSDVMIGEVWLASGQSNMEMGVGYLHGGYSGVANWERELNDAVRPRIRFFTVENTVAATPVNDVKGVWRVADAASVKEFSATAWFFAKQLEHEMNLSIGVVASDWGGTPAEAWTSASALAEFPNYAPALAECAQLGADPSAAVSRRKQSMADYQRLIAEKDPLSAAHAEARAFDDSKWATTEVPGVWSGDLASFDGLVWMRRRVQIPLAWAGRDLELSLGTIDEFECSPNEFAATCSNCGLALKTKQSPP